MVGRGTGNVGVYGCLCPQLLSSQRSGKVVLDFNRFLIVFRDFIDFIDISGMKHKEIILHVFFTEGKRTIILDIEQLLYHIGTNVRQEPPPPYSFPIYIFNVQPTNKEKKLLREGRPPNVKL